MTSAESNEFGRTPSISLSGSQSAPLVFSTIWSWLLLLMTLSALSIPALASTASESITAGVELDRAQLHQARPPGSGLTKDDSAECLQCHRMKTLAYRDPDSGKIRNLSIDPASYPHSVHGDMACRDCHGRGYRRYPHLTSSADEDLGCVKCHSELAEDHDIPALKDIAGEFKQSVHVQERGSQFKCFKCHQAHDFRPQPADTPITERIRQNNQICLDCHQELHGPAPPGHDWLPEVQRHWAAVRCIDCHTPLEGRLAERPSHNILAAKESQRDCVGCHSQDAQLLAQLYGHRLAEERELKGFFQQALHNEAYVIGMSRNPWIDRIAFAIIGLTAFGILLHAWGRWRVSRKGRTDA